MQITYNMDTEQVDSYQQCPLVTVGVNGSAWQHTWWYFSQPSSNFLASNCDCVKIWQISGMPGSPLFPCLPEIELLDQAFLDFGGSQGGRWPSSYQTIICECHSVPHKTALWCQIFSQILIVGSKGRLPKKTSQELRMLSRSQVWLQISNPQWLPSAWP